MNTIKFKKYLFAVLVACGISISANAFLLPPGPGTPTVDAGTDAMFFINTATTTIQNATAQASAFIQNINQQAKALMSEYAGKFMGFVGGIFKKKEKQPLPGTREIQESDLADIYDPASVQAAMYTLFFQYPVDCEDISDNNNIVQCEAYKKLAQEFYQDTIIELYTSSRELEKQFDALEDSINQTEEALAQGSGGMESPDDENGVWKNAYNVYETMNTILKIVEEVQAMRAQYIAAKAIGEKAVYPALPAKSDKKASVIFTSDTPKLANSNIYSISTLQFANQAYEKKVKFTAAPGSKISNPYAANSEDMALMDKIYEAQDLMREAIEVHNQIKGLSTLQGIYDNYNKTQRLHQKAIESLKQAEQCAINYYGSMYNNAREMWNGNLSSSQLFEHDFRKGISGWAIKAYNLAKAEDSGMVVSAEDLSESNVDSSQINNEDLSQIDKVAATIKNDDSGFKDTASQNKINESLKESGRLAWNIGAEAAEILAADQAQYGKNGKWGNAKKLYPIWNDVKSYYSQYIDGKYDNIARQLELINTNAIALEIASKINDIVASDEEHDNNKKGLTRLKNKINKEKSSVITNMENIVTEKKQTLENLYNTKELQIAKLKEQQQKIEEKINAIQAQLDKLNIRLQTASEQRTQAEVTVSNMDVFIDAMIKRGYDIPETEVINIETRQYQQDINAGNIEQHGYNLKSIYHNKETLGYAQLATLSFMNQDELKEYNEPDIRTYTKQVETIETVEVDETREFLLAQHSLEENRQKVLDLSADITSLNAKIAELTSELEKQKAVIENTIKPQIAAINNQYVVDANAVTIEYDKKIAEEDSAYRNALRKINSINLESYYLSHFSIPTLNDDGSSYLFSLPSILRRANNIVAETEGAAQEMIRETVKKMYSLGDNLYNPNYHEQVISYHKELMSNLKQMPSNILKNYGAVIAGYSSYSGIMKLAGSIYQNYMVDDACVKDYCMQTDIEYFVSNNGKRRDFQAPKSVPSISLPSVREVVFFDYSDYDVVPKSENGVIVAKDFLQKITYVPEIWKMMLTSPAYVEKDIDLSTVITPSTEMFVNGGIYPCIYNNYLVMSEGDRYLVYYRKSHSNAEEQALENQNYSQTHSAGYPTCQDLEITGSGSHLTVKNLSDDVSASAKTKSYISFKRPEIHSELGYILQYNKGLRYNDRAEKAFRELSKLNQKGKDAKQEHILYDHASLNQNQIGEFLKAVETEQDMRQNLAEIKVEIETAEETLNETFAKMGFVPSSDFDLAKESDYNLAHNTLLRYRNKLISSIVTLIQPLQSNKNTIIQERLQKVNNVVAAMKKDAEAHVVMGDTSADNAELDENIKTEKANSKVTSKYQKNADDDFEKQMRQIGNVYCAGRIDGL